MATRSRGSRRKTEWAGLGAADGAAALPVPVNLTAGTAAIISAGAVVAGGSGLVDNEVTITRLIANMTCGLRSASADVSGSVAVGCAVVRTEAVAAGVAALPSPESDPDFEWLWYGVFPLRRLTSSQGTPTGADISLVQIDGRAQRIVRTGQTMIWLAESQGDAAFAGIGGRYLVKLP